MTTTQDVNASAHEAYIDEATGVAIVSDIDPSEVEGSDLMVQLPKPIQRAIASWAEEVQSTNRRGTPLFRRDKYVTPEKVLQQMALAQETVDDDIVGNVADMSEALAFQKVAFECADQDQEDVWNQIGRDLDLDGFIRQAWRELFTVSQFYGVRWWGMKEYQVRGKRDKRAARKRFTLEVPLQLGFLDPTRVVPVKPDIFGGSQLAWIGTNNDMKLLSSIGTADEDPLVRQLFVGKYTPLPKEEQDLKGEDIPVDNLILLNPKYVWRHSLTKSTYERWARLRLKSILPLLDLKRQLREMDRAFMLGGINFLVLVTRGSDTQPASKTEVTQTAGMVRTQSKSPIIVSDHRISVEIITPDLEHILSDDKWAVLDERILMRLWGTFQLPSQVSGRETSLTLSRVIARGIESRRHMLKRSLEKYLIREIQESAINKDVEFTEDASIEFAPRRMELEMDPALITVIQELRDRGDISRETVLTELNFDQSLEARRREIEKKDYDKIFTPVNVPFDSPNRVTPGGSGRQGGRPPGQGGQGQSGGNNNEQ